MIVFAKQLFSVSFSAFKHIHIFIDFPSNVSQIRQDELFRIENEAN